MVQSGTATSKPWGPAGCDGARSFDRSPAGISAGAATAALDFYGSLDPTPWMRFHGAGPIAYSPRNIPRRGCIPCKKKGLARVLGSLAMSLARVVEWAPVVRDFSRSPLAYEFSKPAMQVLSHYFDTDDNFFSDAYSASNWAVGIFQPDFSKSCDSTLRKHLDPWNALAWRQDPAPGTDRHRPVLQRGTRNEIIPTDSVAGCLCSRTLDDGANRDADQRRAHYPDQ